MAVSTVVNQVIQDLDKYMGQVRSYYRDWYVGIASDPRQRLFVDHCVQEKGNYWIFRDCGSDGAARAVEEFFLRKGCDGGSGGGDRTTRYAYAYHKERNTNP